MRRRRSSAIRRPWSNWGERPVYHVAHSVRRGGARRMRRSSPLIEDLLSLSRWIVEVEAAGRSCAAAPRRNEAMLGMRRHRIKFRCAPPSLRWQSEGISRDLRRPPRPDHFPVAGENHFELGWRLQRPIGSPLLLGLRSGGMWAETPWHTTVMPTRNTTQSLLDVSTA